MSGTASRYIGGVPYGPAMGVGRYPTRPSVVSAPGPRNQGGGTLAVPPAATNGVGIALDPSAGRVQPVFGGAGNVGGGGGGGDMGGQNMLLAAALGLLPYVPDAIDWISRQFASDPPAAAAQQQFPDDPTPLSDGVTPTDVVPGGLDAGTFTGPGGVQIPNAALGGFGTNWDNVFEPGWQVIDDPASLEQLLRPIETPAAPGATDGFQAMGATPDEFASVSARGPGAVGAGPGDITGWGAPGTTFNNPLSLPAGAVTTTPGALGTVAGYDVLANAAYLPAAVIGYGSQSLAKPGGEMGATIGAGAGTLIGSIVGGPWGAALGALAGGGIGGQIGAAPTIGRNFAGTGTFNADGSLAWGGFGGDNGGGADAAQGFANQFGQNLLAQAAQQGLAFNPNMAGVQFNVGGFDNFSRVGSTPGGFFYDPYRGGSPENYALRPNPGMDPYSAQQGNTLAQAALADLAARGVFTQGGQPQPGMDYYQQTIGAPLGGYGAMTFGGNDIPDFGQMLAMRQGDIGGWMAGAQQRQTNDAAMQQYADAMAGSQVGPDGNPIFANVGAVANPYASEAGWNTGGG
jgi:hypothetical protein